MVRHTRKNVAPKMYYFDFAFHHDLIKSSYSRLRWNAVFHCRQSNRDMFNSVCQHRIGKRDMVINILNNRTIAITRLYFIKKKLSAFHIYDMDIIWLFGMVMTSANWRHLCKITIMYFYYIFDTIAYCFVCTCVFIDKIGVRVFHTTKTGPKSQHVDLYSFD